MKKHYIIGDVHGEYKTLLALLEKIPKDSEIIFVGDIVDRGLQSREMVALVRERGYRVVNGLKKQFEKTKQYKKYMNMLRVGATKLRQTDLAFLILAKLRKNGRFQAISRLNKWSKKLIDKKIFSKRGRAKKGTILGRLRGAFSDFKSLEPFIKNFIKTTDITNKIMKLLKNEGLTIATYHQVTKLLKKLPKNSKTRKTLRIWLERHIKIQK